MYSGADTNHRITFRFDDKGKKVEDVKESKAVELKVETVEPSLQESTSHQYTATANNIAVRDSDAEKSAETSIRKQNTAVIKKAYPSSSNTSIDSVKDLNPWESPFQNDALLLEKLIRETNQLYEQKDDAKEHKEKVQSTAEAETDKGKSQLLKRLAQPKHETEQPSSFDDFLYTGNEEEEVELSSVLESRYSRKSRGPSWGQVLLYIAGALSTGALFGYIILTMFLGGTFWEKNDLGNAVSVQGVIDTDKEKAGSIDSNNKVKEAEAEPGGAELTPDGAVKAVALTGGKQSYYMLQFGMFSKKESRDAALQDLTSKGIAASTAQSGDEYRVYAGITQKQADAQILLQKYPLDLYIKELVLVQPQAIPFEGSAETANRYFEQSATLIASWSAMIGAQLEQPSLSPLGEAAATALQEQFAAWTETNKLMKSGMSDEQSNKFLTSISGAIEDGAAAIKAYNEQAAMKHLQTAEQSMMKAVLAQKDWFEALTAL